MLQAKPIVLLPACNRMLGAHPFHVAGRKYLEAARLAGGLPLIVGRAEADEFDQLLDLADGILLTGSPSNVDPAHYGQARLDHELGRDEQRDRWVLPLIPRALAAGVPLLAICRGAQEVNVALGGSLHQAVQDVEGHSDHRADAAQPVATQYGPAHEVLAVPGGPLERIVGKPRFMVNSIHGQGVSRLADGLCATAHAPDGLVEAFFAPDAPGFNLCVQWHPEWLAADNVESVSLFRAFGDAVRHRHTSRLAQVASS